MDKSTDRRIAFKRCADVHVYYLAPCVRLPQGLMNWCWCCVKWKTRLVQVTDPSQSRFPASLFSSGRQIWFIPFAYFFAQRGTVSCPCTLCNGIIAANDGWIRIKLGTPWAVCLHCRIARRRTQLVYFLGFSIWTAASLAYRWSIRWVFDTVAEQLLGLWSLHLSLQHCPGKFRKVRLDFSLVLGLYWKET